jgi:UDP-N-acetylglucosamine--N-acetylmuramyl-(pentapeptide) pyrophosphoryl-undecaprenol N-acetylglucosamine transferase
MRMIVAGGGTGGHLFPGLAVADVLAARGVEVLFVGSAHGLEATAVPKTQFPFRALDVQAVRGRGLRGLVSFAWQMPVALLHAWRIVGAYRPQLVLGLGGYGSVPVVMAAWLRRVPSVLMEQNVHPGMANRFLALLARRVCTTFSESGRFFPSGKAMQTGNPVRCLRTTVRASAEPLTLFIFGGSQGAHRINAAAVDAVEILREKHIDLQVIHQTGVADEEWVRRRYLEMGVVAEVLPFIDDMAAAYGRAALVVCRAGATTLAELASVGKPAILVPYPFAADDHQRSNAEVLVRHGAAELILDAALTGATLAARVLALAHDPERLRAMGAAARQLDVPDAAARVAEVCWQAAQQGG